MYIDGVEVNVIPQIGMGVTYHSGKRLCPRYYCENI